MGFWDSIGNGLSDVGSGISSALGVGSGDPANADRDALRNAGTGAQGLGAAGAANYSTDRAGMAGTQQYLQGQMQGQNSVSATQLQQGLQQGLGAQQSMAASANPQNAAMAARNAAMNMGRLSYGLSGQQALAGQQERNAAASQLGQMQLGQSGQDIQAGLGGYQTAAGAYGNAVANPQKGWGGMLQGALQGASSAAMAAAL